MRFYTNVQTIGNFIYERWIEKNEDGEYNRFNHKVMNFTPSIFLECEDENSKYRSILNKPLREVKHDSLKACLNFMRQYKGVSGFEMYGNTNWQYQYISEKYTGKIEWNEDQIRVFYVDIETESDDGFPDVQKADKAITSITLWDSIDNYYYVWGVGDYKESKPNLKYFRFLNDFELLKHFLKFWKTNCPDAVTGWYINGFDIPYIINRSVNAHGLDVEKYLSPFSNIIQSTKYFMGKTHTNYKISGVEILDYMDLYKKFTDKVRESYKLDFIGYVELGMNKLSQNEEIAGYDLYKTDYQKFIEYNIRDVDIIVELEKKIKLISLVFTMAYDAKENYEDVLSQVRTWDCLIYNYLKERNIVLPPRKHKEKREYEGAYVMEPKPDRYEWVVSFDVASLYPSIIRSFNIGPDTKMKMINGIAPQMVLDKKIDTNQLKKKEVSLAANGCLYTNKNKGFMAELVKKIFNERKKTKKEMLELKKKKDDSFEDQISVLNIKQKALKIQLNSLYGALGNEYFRLYDVDNAEAVTITGQSIIKWIGRELNRFLGDYFNKEERYVIYSDTDSVYIQLKPFVDDLPSDLNLHERVSKVDEFCDTVIQKKIDKIFDDYCKYLNVYENCFAMERECIADNGIWTAKKRYMLNIYDMEGVRYDEPELKIMGIESARSSTPEICRDKIKECIKIILNGNRSDVFSFIKKFKSEFKNFNPEDIAKNTSVNGLNEYHSRNTIYKKQTPMHVRGALLYNNFIMKNNLQKTHPLIREGEKIKSIYLKVPNPIHENTISFVSFLPDAFGLKKYVDYDTQFDKMFLEPVKNILEVIGWQYTTKATF